MSIIDIINACGNNGVVSYKDKECEILFKNSVVAPKPLICDNINNVKGEEINDNNDVTDENDIMLIDPLEYENKLLKELGAQ